MNTLQKKQLALLNETVSYYSENPIERRCKSTYNRCYYSPEKANKPNSEGCAVGRLLSPTKRKYLDMAFENCDTSVEAVFDNLPKKIQVYGMDFLEELQSLHDVSVYWDDKGITKDGLGKVERIKSNFNLHNE